MGAAGCRGAAKPPSLRLAIIVCPKADEHILGVFLWGLLIFNLD